jgi:ligand-binding sensor domain-containing protein
MNINRNFVSIITTLFISLIITGCGTKFSVNNLKQETGTAPVKTTPSPINSVSPSPTKTQIQSTSTLEAPIRGLDINEWSVFPEATNLLKCQSTFITQTTEDTMWFGCGLGITSFDGSTWNIYTSKDFFNISGITSVCPEPNGNLWLGTEKDGLLIYRGDKWENILSTDGLVSDEVTSLAITSDGIVWVGTKRGISQFDGNQWTSYYPTQIQDDDYILAIAETTDGNIWFGSEKGKLLFFDGTDWHRYTRTYSKFGSPIVDMAASEDNSLWVIIGSDILQIIGEEPNFYQNDALNYSPPTSIEVKANGSVWIGAYGGYKVAHLEGETWRTIQGDDILKFPSTHDQSLPFSGVFTVFEDHAGALWFGTAWGAYRYKQ